jgi:hypothetical protein
MHLPTPIERTIPCCACTRVFYADTPPALHHVVQHNGQVPEDHHASSEGDGEGDVVEDAEAGRHHGAHALATWHRP